MVVSSQTRPPDRSQTRPPDRSVTHEWDSSAISANMGMGRCGPALPSAQLDGMYIVSTAPPPSRSSDDRLPPPPHLKRIGVAPTLMEYIADLWAHRDFLITVPLGELRAQNQNSVLGNFWHLLNPLLLAGVYYLVFGVIFAARRDIAYYPAFLIIGIMTFTYIGKVIQSGARTVVANKKLIQSIRFPRASLPLASTVSETIAHVPALLTMMVLVSLTSLVAIDPITGAALPVILPSVEWLLLLPAMVLMSMFGMGLSLVTARATFHFRDIQQLLPYVLRIWMYASGLFYNLEFVSARVSDDSIWLVIFKANPLWQFFQIFRDVLIGESFNGRVWAAATGWSVASLVVGFLWFRSHEVEYSRG
jgi:teichoic acid transport system permease protein